MKTKKNDKTDVFSSVYCSLKWGKIKYEEDEKSTNYNNIDLPVLIQNAVDSIHGHTLHPKVGIAHIIIGAISGSISRLPLYAKENLGHREPPYPLPNGFE